MSGFIKKFLKLTIYLVLVAVVFVVTIAGVFIATFDANQYKQNLSDLVREHSGRDLKFDGDVSLTFYPALGMKLGAMSLSNAPGFGTAPMISVGEASISVDVASLLALNPEVDRLVLRNLDINLEKNKNGVTNWDDLTKTDPAADKEESTGAQKGDRQPLTIRGAFGGVDIDNAKLLWTDRQAGVEYRVNDLDIRTGRITPDAPFPLYVHAAVQSGNELSLVMDLDSRIHYLIDRKKLNLSDLDIALIAEGSLLPVDPMSIGVNADQLALDPTARSIDVRGLGLALNNLALKGNVSLPDYAESSARFNLTADTLDIDELLGTPPPGTQPETIEPPEAVETGSAEDIEIKLPMELIRSLDIDGSLNIARLKLQNLWMERVEVGLRVKDGIVDLKPLRMSLYEGGFDGAVQIDARGSQPKYRLSKKLEAVQAGKLLTDFTGKDKISGALTASIDLGTTGEWLSELKRNSNGEMSLAFRDGAIKGFNVRYLIEKAKARIRGQTPPDESARKTDFSALSLSGRIEKGVFRSSDLNLQAPALRVGGKGRADLNDNSVDYLVNAKVVGTLKAQQAGGQDELSGVLIPVRIVGPFSAPDVDVQLDEMLKAQSDAKIAEEKARLKAQIEEEKAALQKQIDEQKAALEAAKQEEIEKQKAVIEARKKAEEEKAKDKLKDKLKNLFD